MAPIDPAEVYLGTVDTNELHSLNWPFHQILTPHFVEQCELQRHVRRVLAEGHWHCVRAVPHAEAGQVVNHRYDLYAT